VLKLENQQFYMMRLNQ